MTNDDADDRAIDRALGIDDDSSDDAAVSEAAVHEYEDVLTYLPFDEVQPPADLEGRMLAAARRARPPATGAIDHARRRRGARWAAAAVAIAAAAAIALLVLPSDDNDSLDARIQTAASVDDVAAALERDGTRTTELDGVGAVALTTDGTGYLYDVTRETAPTDQLGLLVGDEQIVIGTIPDAEVVRFEVTGDVAAVTGVFVARDGEVVVSANF